MSTLEITPQLKVQMLKTLIAGHDLDYAAMATQVPRTKILDIVSAHGYPDHDRMSWAVDMLIQGANKIPQRHAVSSGTPLDSPPPVTRRPPPERPADTTTTTDVLRQAEQSTQARTRNLAAKISTLLQDLTGRLADEQEAHEAKAKAERENAQVAARIAALEAEIAKLKGKRAKPAKTKTGQIPSARKYGPHPGEHPCPTPGCDRTFDTSQGVHLHQRRTHNGFSPNGQSAS